jgi:hypothetical protein
VALHGTATAAAVLAIAGLVTPAAVTERAAAMIVAGALANPSRMLSPLRPQAMNLLLYTETAFPCAGTKIAGPDI